MGGREEKGGRRRGGAQGAMKFTQNPHTVYIYNSPRGREGEGGRREGGEGREEGGEAQGTKILTR